MIIETDNGSTINTHRGDTSMAVASETTKDLTFDEILDMLVDAVRELSEKQDLLLEQQQELREAISNLSLPGADYGAYGEQ